MYINSILFIYWRPREPCAAAVGLAWIMLSFTFIYRLLSSIIDYAVCTVYYWEYSKLIWYRPLVVTCFVAGFYTRADAYKIGNVWVTMTMGFACVAIYERYNDKRRRRIWYKYDKADTYTWSLRSSWISTQVIRFQKQYDIRVSTLNRVRQNGRCSFKKAVGKRRLDSQKLGLFYVFRYTRRCRFMHQVLKITSAEINQHARLIADWHLFQRGICF